MAVAAAIPPRAADLCSRDETIAPVRRTRDWRPNADGIPLRAGTPFATSLAARAALLPTSGGETPATGGEPE